MRQIPDRYFYIAGALALVVVVVIGALVIVEIASVTPEEVGGFFGRIANGFTETKD